MSALPNDRPLLEWRAYLLAELGEPINAQALWKRVQSLPRPATNAVEKIRLLGSDTEIMPELEYRAAPFDANAARPISRRPFISAADLRLNPAWDRMRPLQQFAALLARLEKDARFAPHDAVLKHAALTE